MASILEVGPTKHRVRYSLRLPGKTIRRTRYARTRPAAAVLRTQLEAVEAAVTAGGARICDIEEWVGRGWVTHQEALLAFRAYRDDRGERASRAATDLELLERDFEVYALEHSKAKDAARKTHQNRMGLARHTLAWLRTEHPTLQLTQADVAAWLASLTAQGYSEWTRHHYLQQLRILLDLARARSMVDANPARDARLPLPKRQRARRILTPQEAGHLLQVSLGYRDRIYGGVPTVVRLGLYAGLRPEEMCWLTWEALDLPARLLHVQQTVAPYGERWTPKDAELRTLDVKRELVDYLVQERERQRAARIAGPFVLIGGHPRKTQYRGRVVGSTAIQHAFSAMVAAEGLDSRITLYSLRHTYCTALLRAGVDLETVRDRMGHSDIRTTQGYLHALRPEEHPSDVLPY